MIKITFERDDNAYLVLVRLELYLEFKFIIKNRYRWYHCILKHLKEEKKQDDNLADNLSSDIDLIDQGVNT